MELTMTNGFGFCELNENEMMVVDGGGLTSNDVENAFKATASVFMVVMSPAITYVNAPLGVAAFCYGVSGFGKATGLY